MEPGNFRLHACPTCVCASDATALAGAQRFTRACLQDDASGEDLWREGWTPRTELWSAYLTFRESDPHDPPRLPPRAFYAFLRSEEDDAEKRLDESMRGGTRGFKVGLDARS